MELYFNILIGKTISRIVVCKDPAFVYFYTNDGNYILHYKFVCSCTVGYVEDICGDLGDLIGVPVLSASFESNVNEFKPDDEHDHGTYWNFYKISTVKGYVTIRYDVSSNEFYGFEVSFEEHNDDFWMQLPSNYSHLKGKDLDLSKFDTVSYGAALPIEDK